MPDPLVTGDEAIGLAPDITVRTIRPVHAELLSALTRGVHVRVDCSAILHCDLSLLQLLVSASRAFADHRLDFAIEHAGESLVTSFSRAGLRLPAAA